MQCVHSIYLYVPAFSCVRGTGVDFNSKPRSQTNWRLVRLRLEPRCKTSEVNLHSRLASSCERCSIPRCYRCHVCWGKLWLTSRVGFFQMSHTRYARVPDLKDNLWALDQDIHQIPYGPTQKKSSQLQTLMNFHGRACCRCSKLWEVGWVALPPWAHRVHRVPHQQLPPAHRALVHRAPHLGRHPPCRDYPEPVELGRGAKWSTGCGCHEGNWIDIDFANTFRKLNILIRTYAYFFKIISLQIDGYLNLDPWKFW